ncbi:hypothetical protein EDC01DRAFT_626468 [Geopyxis carbonaria]|nr:hypothetical protein EDC01DRAFT_626468 [Geopyxis carbonaria]
MPFDGTEYKHDEIKFPGAPLSFTPSGSELIQPPLHIDDDLENFVEGLEDQALNDEERIMGKLSTDEINNRGRLLSYVPVKPSYYFGSTRTTEKCSTQTLIHHFVIPEYPDTSDDGIGHLIHLDGNTDPWIIRHNVRTLVVVQYSLLRKGSGNIITSDFLNTKVKRIYQQCQGVKHQTG